MLRNVCRRKIKFTPEQAIKAERGDRGIAVFFLQLRRQKEWVVNAATWLLYPSAKGLGTHCRGGWVDPRASLHECGKSRPLLGSET
jgi:hypothetical protein